MADKGHGDWAHSLFGCCEESSSCCLGFWCPCCLYGRNMERAGQGSCCACGAIFCVLTPLYLCFIPGTVTRGRVRAKYALDGACASDCAVYFFCALCAVCQEAREIRARGTGQGGSRSVMWWAVPDCMCAQPEEEESEVQTGTPRAGQSEPAVE